MGHTSQWTKDVDEAGFAAEVLQRSQEVPVVVDFWAEWCGPCRVLGPTLERLAAEHGGAFELAKIDVDRNPQVAASYGVQGIPTVVAFRNGREVARFTGAYPEPALRQWLEGILPSELDAMVDQARTALIEGDLTTAEHLFRQVLERRPDHAEAGTGLASLLIERGDVEEALVVLGKLTPDTEVERLQAAARLRAAGGPDDLDELERRVAVDPGDAEARLELARALAGRREYEPALDHLLAVVRAKGPHREAARQAMVDIFGVIGDDHPLTRAYRKQLANALF